MLSGNLRQISLFSVLQALAANNSTGNLIIHGSRLHASVYIERGQLVCIRLNRYTGPKAFYRLMNVQEGKFEFFSPGRQPASTTWLVASSGRHLLEAARHIDELTVLREKLPDGASRLRFNPKMIAPVAKIPYPMLEVMAAIQKHETMTGTLNGCSLPDLDVCRILHSLLANKVVQVVPGKISAC